jgi:hypothetical protein
MIKGIVGLLVMLAWGFWILWAANPYDRLERACAPLSLSGNLMTSASMLLSPAATKQMDLGVQHAVYGCTFALWRLFYESAYVEQQRADAASGPRPAAALTENRAVAPPQPRTTEPAPAAAPAAPGATAHGATK